MREAHSSLEVSPIVQGIGVEHYQGQVPVEDVFLVQLDLISIAI